MGMLVRASTAAYRINPDSTYALGQYVVISGDRDLPFEEEAEMLVEPARVSADIGFVAKTDNRFHIYGVRGPDEYTTLVDDNAFTHLMARHNLRLAVETLRVLHAEDPVRYELSREKIAWRISRSSRGMKPRRTCLCPTTNSGDQ
jgi:alpha,alpha-trehalose phosphorylase